MPRKHSTVKATSLQRNLKPKVLKWETKVLSRGIKYVPVEVRDTASQPRPRKRASKRKDVENDDMLQSETAPKPMDVDEIFWVEELVMPTSGKRVRQPVCPSLANLTNLPVSTRLH